MYNELIDALQCARHFALYQDCYERNCYANSGKGLYCNIPKLMADAADAIERLTDEVDRKDKALQAWVKTWESRKENAIRHICDHCDTPIDVRLKEGACEDCPIITLVKEIFDEQPS